ncbi:MAG: hypothetical protein LBR08_09725 [Bacteroidales bacterium]|nr:hypothetical protein [Bacteroidales bacterium]
MKYRNLTNSLKVGLFAGIIAAGSFLVSCEDTAQDPAPEIPSVDTVNYNISVIAELSEKMPQISTDAEDDRKVVNINITGNIGIDSLHMNLLQILGNMRQKSNVKITWGNFYVYPLRAGIELSLAEWEKWNRPALNINNESGSMFSADKDEVENFGQYAGVLLPIRDRNWKTGDIDIETVAQLGEKCELARIAAVSGRNVSVALNDLMVHNQHVSDLGKLIHDNITVFGSVLSGADSVAITAALAKKMNIRNIGKYNNGRMFFVSGANGADDLVGSALPHVRTDTASYGADGHKLENLLPNQLFYNVHTANAGGLLRLSDSPRNISVTPRKDENLPGGEAALGNVTNPILKTFNTPAAPFGKPYVFRENPVLTTYANVFSYYSDRTRTIDGIAAAPMNVTELGDSVGTDGSFQMLKASNHKVSTQGAFKNMPYDERLFPQIASATGDIRIKYTAAGEYKSEDGRVYVAYENLSDVLQTVYRPASFENITVSIKDSDVMFVLTEEVRIGTYQGSASQAQANQKLLDMILQIYGISVENTGNVQYITYSQLPAGKKTR